MNLLLAYCTVVGGLSASTQLARGVVRGVGQLAASHPRAAAIEIAGGLAATVKTAYRQVVQLGVEIHDTAHVISGAVKSSWLQRREQLGTKSDCSGS